ncbi:MAG: DNA-binding protein WhiA [Christensenellales bacterium]|jgi:DNA-binding protein WhiA
MRQKQVSGDARSFSAMVKDELAHVVCTKRCCRLAELAGLVHACGGVGLSGSGLSLRLHTERAAVARRAYLILKELYGVKAEVMVSQGSKLAQRNRYALAAPPGEATDRMLQDTGAFTRQEGRIALHQVAPARVISKECCQRAYLRGVFLGAGSLADPAKAYHLEFVAGDDQLAFQIQKSFAKIGIKAKTIQRKGHDVVYLKEAENIAMFLSLAGANNARLDFENIRVVKDVRNQVNRTVNCENANLNKTVDAAGRQLASIRYLQEKVGLDHLPEALEEIARARLENPEVSLTELGGLLSPPVGKSGVNHRMRKLEKMAQQLREAKEEQP